MDRALLSSVYSVSRHAAYPVSCGTPCGTPVTLICNATFKLFAPSKYHAFLHK